MIAVVAVMLGYAARRNASLGVAGLARGLPGAFVAITRPESRTIDVIPPAIGVAAGIIALLWLTRMSAPLMSSRAAEGKPPEGTMTTNIDRRRFLTAAGVAPPP